MLKSKDMKKGVVIEVTSLNNMMFFGDIFNTRSKKELMAIGEQYELVKDVKKSGGALIATLKQINGNKGGEVFWVFINKEIKIISIPTPVVNNNPSSETELKLSDNEEYIIVKKSNPQLFYKSLASQYHYAGRTVLDKNETLDGSFVLTNKIGQRKKFKNLQSLYGFLHNASGKLSYGYMRDFSPEEEYHMHALQNIPEWAMGDGILKVNDLKEVELRKYNTETKTVSSQAVEFDLYDYVKKYSQKMDITKLYGEAISHVIMELTEQNKINELPYIFSAKMDYSKYKYIESVPKEKDIYLDLLLKELGLKKKDCIMYNNKGFIAIACEGEEKAKEYAKKYQNKEKMQSILSVNEILNNSKLKEENLESSNKLNKIKF